jgi:hypothetical protein
VSRFEESMRGVTLAIRFVLVVAANSSLAQADTAPAVSGLAVVALAGAADAAWPLAREIYSSASLRPSSIDEPHARVLCGEAAPSGAPIELRDLAETVAAVHGDDPPSRALLGDVARRFSVRAVVVVRVDAGHPAARVFMADASVFDAATYAPDATASVSWSGAVQSLTRTFASEATPRETMGAPGVVHAPSLTTHGPTSSVDRSSRQGTDSSPPRRREFYESGWFWGALAAAAFVGGAVFLATRDSGASVIHLHLEVPH